MHAKAHSPGPSSSTLVGASSPMRELRLLVERVAPSDMPVLVQGESGAGKELTARALHEGSARPLGPFVAVNCGAIPRELICAELFGATAGAFTGARPRVGVIAEADGGTLFLDEIGDLPLEAQAVLLRVLETRRVQPVGGGRPTRVDFRVVCATHRDLRDMVRTRAFRHDLYQRLAGVVVAVPSLRARASDIPDLASALFGARVVRIQADAWDALRLHDWPGNVRELRNAIQRALVCTDGPIHASDLRLESVSAGPQRVGMVPLRVAMARYVSRVYSECGQDGRRTARVLECSPTTVVKYLNRASTEVGFAG